MPFLISYSCIWERLAARFIINSITSKGSIPCLQDQKTITNAVNNNVTEQLDRCVELMKNADFTASKMTD